MLAESARFYWRQPCNLNSVTATSGSRTIDALFYVRTPSTTDQSHSAPDGRGQDRFSRFSRDRATIVDGTGERLGASYDSWSSGCDAASPPIEEVGPAVVPEAAFDGEQDVGSGLQPAAPGSFESAAYDLLAGAFHDAGSDRQSALPAEVAAHSVLVGTVGADECRDSFKPAVRLQVGDDVADPPCVQLALDRLHPILPFALVRRRGSHSVNSKVERDCDRELYKLRNEVERLFRRFKGCRPHPHAVRQARRVLPGILNLALVVEMTHDLAQTGPKSYSPYPFPSFKRGQSDKKCLSTIRLGSFFKHCAS